jgi:hypothetical protein
VLPPATHSFTLAQPFLDSSPTHTPFAIYLAALEPAQAQQNVQAIQIHAESAGSIERAEFSSEV